MTFRAAMTSFTCPTSTALPRFEKGGMAKVIQHGICLVQIERVKEATAAGDEWHVLLFRISLLFPWTRPYPGTSRRNGFEIIVQHLQVLIALIRAMG